jgi:hypothetical protein
LIDERLNLSSRGQLEFGAISDCHSWPPSKSVIMPWSEKITLLKFHLFKYRGLKK